MTAATNPEVRHDIVWLFDITDGNPNGDPDAGNRPRVDPETNHGLMTDVSLKRKIRDTIGLAADGAAGYDIFVTAGTALNETLEKSYQQTGLRLGKDTKDAAQARDWLCTTYFDIRMFGGVLSTGNTPALGQIRGPLQVSFARSFDPVTPSEHAITRVAHTTAKDAEKGGGTMGSKWTVPYALFRATLSYSAVRGTSTKVTERDLELLYRTLVNLFDHTSSAARPSMSTRGVYVFSHDDAFGKAPMQALVERIRVSKTDGVSAPRAFDDYVVNLDRDGLPEGVTLDALL